MALGDTGLIELSTLTLNAREADLASEAIFEKVFEKPELQSMHGVRTGIDMTTQIPFLGKFSPFLLKDPGSCGTNAVSQTISTSEKYWLSTLLSGRLTHCQGDQTSTLWKMWRKQAKVNPDYWDTVDNEELAFLESRIIDAVSEDILLKTMFGDTAADNVSGGGNITNGKAPALFTPLDGFWKQILTGVVATTVKRYEITENSGASYAAQASLADDRAYLAMQYLYNNADSRIFQTDIKYQMTRSLWNNYRDYLESKSLSFTVERTEEGTTKAAYRGIEIIVRDDWDRNITEYFDNGTTYLNPHRIILTDINNLPIGTLEEGSMKSLDMFYHRKDKKHYTDAAMTLDAKLLEESMIIVGY